jgi:hypothetical protein
MPRADYKTCKRCERHTNECGVLSHTRLCADCGREVLTSSIIEQASHSGPIFQHWRRRIAASVGATVLDDQRASP